MPHAVYRSYIVCEDKKDCTRYIFVLEKILFLPFLIFLNYCSSIILQNFHYLFKLYLKIVTIYFIF